MTAAVIGLGKIGLPLSAQCASRGETVIAVDIDSAVVATVNAGRMPFHEPGVDALLAAAVAEGQLRATTDTAEAVRAAEVVLVVVPLVVDSQRRPDFTAIDSATEAIAAALQPGTLVVYETTLPIGTTRGRFAPALAARSGLTLGTDLFVGHSPERVSSGTVLRDLRRFPKLVGGIDADAAARMVAFYERVLELDPRTDLDRPNGVWDLGSAEAAEMTKLAETTYRDLNIAYANELAMAADRAGIDVRTVIAAANSQPFSHVHTPGIAVGGHCIPVYPWFLIDSAPGVELPAVARAINDRMPAYGVDLVAERLGGLEGRHVAVLGLCYRGDVKEAAFSGAFGVVQRIEALGGTATVHDPLFEDDEIRQLGLIPHALGAPADATILQADHAAYSSLSLEDLGGATVVLDGRGVLDASDLPGVSVIRIGAPPR